METVMVIVIIDDDIHAAQDLLLEIKPLGMAVTGVFDNVEAAQAFLSTSRPVDIIFCDMQMPGINGLMAAEILRPFCRYFIAVTAYEEYAYQAFEKEVDTYLLKPVKRAEVERKLERFARMRMDSAQFALHYRRKLRTTKQRDGEPNEQIIDLRQVVQVKSAHNNTYYVVDGESVRYQSRISLKELLQDYPELFVRIQNRLLVAKNAIQFLELDTVWLNNGNKYKVSPTYREELVQYAQSVGLTPH